MPEYAIVRNSDDKIFRFVEKDLTAEEEANVMRKFGPGKRYRWLPVGRQRDRVMDPVTRKLGPEVIKVNSDSVLIVRRAVSLSSDELQAVRDETDARAERQAIDKAMKDFVNKRGEIRDAIEDFEERLKALESLVNP